MNLPQPVAAGVWVVLGVVLLVLVLLGRRRLAGRSAGLVPTPPAVPAEPGRGDVVLGPLEALYVSSTLGGDWLARVGSHGLGDRSRAVVTVHAGGLHVARTGTADLWIPADAVSGAALTPGMAGKFVGKEAIVVVSWTVPAEPVPATDGTPADTTPAPVPVALDTGLMPRHDDDVPRLLDAVQTMADARTERRTPAPPRAVPDPVTPADPARDPQPERDSAAPDDLPNDKDNS